MLPPGVVLQNRYRIIRQLGQGGMGTVYEAIDQRFDSQVAIKEARFNEVALRKQFAREAKLLNQLRHPAVTRVMDHFTEGDSQFLVMDFIAGEDLWELLRKRGVAFPVAEVLGWAEQLLDALRYLHNQHRPIIHRDIKPHNLKLLDTGQIILLDFGLAKGFVRRASRASSDSSIFGYTLNYAPLEQIQGTGTDSRSDLYSLGATLYHLMTGAVPPDVLTRVAATTDGQPDPLRPAHEINRLIPAEVSGVLNTAMAVGRNRRPADAAEMRRMLHEATLARLPPGSGEPPGFLPQTLTDTHQANPIREAPLTPVTPRGDVFAAETLVPAPPAAAREVSSKELPPPLRASDTTAHASTPLIKPARKRPPPLWVVAGLIVLVFAGSLIAFLISNRPPPENQRLVDSTTTSDTGPIRVGVYADLSGITADFGRSTVNGIVLAADEINKEGGIDGRRIEIFVEDDQGTPLRAKTVVTKLINQDRVHAVLGGASPTCSIAAAPEAQAAKVPMVAPFVTHPKVTQFGDYVFRVCFIDQFQGAVMARFARDPLSAQTAAVLFDRDSDYSQSLAKAFEETFSKLGGRVVAKQTYAVVKPGDTKDDKDAGDFRPQLNSIRAANPDVIFVPGYYFSVGIIARQAKELGIKPPLLGTDAWDSPELWAIGGNALDGSYMVNYYSIDDPADILQRFVSDYQSRYEDQRPDVFAAHGYDAMKLLKDAVERAGTTESQKLRNAIAQTRGFLGVTGNITIDPQRNAVKPAMVWQLRGGRLLHKSTIQPR
jgi:branched-chain amino acid transport system substrate-binding protein